MNIGYGKTAKSPLEAEPLGMFRHGVDEYVMNRDRLLDTATRAALAMAPAYVVTTRDSLNMAGRDVWQEMVDWLNNTRDKCYMTPPDVTTGTQIAMIVTGGDVDAGTKMSEQD